MEPITIELLKKTIGADTNIWWKLRECSFCRCGIGYSIDSKYWEVYFNSACDCTSHNESVRFTSLKELLEMFNMQTFDARLSMWENFKDAVERGTS